MFSFLWQETEGYRGACSRVYGFGCLRSPCYFDSVEACFSGTVGNAVSFFSRLFFLVRSFEDNQFSLVYYTWNFYSIEMIIFGLLRWASSLDLLSGSL